MNSCILMAEIVEEPQLRFTPGDPQIPVAEMLVQFPGQREEDPPYTLKVVGWGNLAQEVHQSCHRGDRVVIEGRLNMLTVERKQEGFKEKRAELTAQKIHHLGSNDGFQTATPVSTSAKNTTSYVGSDSYRSPVATTTVPPVSKSASNVATVPADDYEEPMPTVTPKQFPNQPMTGNQPDVDDIPF